MTKVLVLIFILVLGVIFIENLLILSSHQKLVKSESGYQFYINRDGNEKMKANILSAQYSDVEKLCKILHLIDDKPKNLRVPCEKLIEHVRRKGSTILREAEKKESFSSYTVDNDTIYLCLETDDTNVLFYVLLHELCHIAVNCVDHCADFWTLFNFLKHVCHRNKLLAPIHENVDYCGIRLFSEK